MMKNRGRKVKSLVALQRIHNQTMYNAEAV